MKRVRLILIVLVLSALALLGFAPPAAADGAVPSAGCKGYWEVASIRYDGIRFSTKLNICLHDHGPVANQQYSWGGVARALCYRNGVLFGDGNGGCRWAGHVTLEDNNSGEQVNTYVAEPGSSWSGFLQDSGRMWSYTTPRSPSSQVRACWRDGQVRWRGISGTDIGLYNTVDVCGPWRYANS